MAKSVKSLTLDEKRLLRNKAKNELVRLKYIIGDAETKKIVNDFKEKFSICEIVYKIILDNHQFNKTGKHPNRMIITMQQVPHALKYAGYDFEKDLLTNLFGASHKIGQRSVKSLRDSLTHSLKQRDIEEIKERYDELHSYMDDFIEKIFTYDSGV